MRRKYFFQQNDTKINEKNSIRINAHNFVILSLVFLKLLIVGVAFFLGHPVYIW